MLLCVFVVWLCGCWVVGLLGCWVVGLFGCVVIQNRSQIGPNSVPKGSQMGPKWVPKRVPRGPYDLGRSWGAFGNPPTLRSRVRSLLGGRFPPPYPPPPWGPGRRSAKNTVFIVFWLGWAGLGRAGPGWAGWAALAWARLGSARLGSARLGLFIKPLRTHRTSTPFWRI